MRYIYGLRDPRTKKIRYIGKADNPKNRLQNHLCPSNLVRKKHTSQWLALLKRLGLKPILVILQELDNDEDWEAAERRWIKNFKDAGCDLTNITEGGEGGATYGRLGKPWTEEHRKRYTESRKGVPISADAKTHSPENRKKRGEAIAQHWKEVRARGGKKKGQVHTPESKARLSEAHTGKILTAEHKRKLSFAKLGRTWSVKRQLMALKKEIH